MALALHSAGRKDEALRVAMETQIEALHRYQRSMRNYAAALMESATSGDPATRLKRNSTAFRHGVTSRRARRARLIRCDDHSFTRDSATRPWGPSQPGSIAAIPAAATGRSALTPFRLRAG
ncbi:tetratricopeptide repeat protein [Microbacterium sp. NPDC096154]|uniref:tetratricopeptide repeat protein n=1 Tax=Microbacterium sp. NPDC096154 TaxID=3155549 RepID=UPI00332F0DBD